MHSQFDGKDTVKEINRLSVSELEAGKEKVVKKIFQLFLDREDQELYLCTPKYKEGQQRLATISKREQVL